MEEFTIRYWFGDDSSSSGAQSVPYVSEGFGAENLDEATRRVQERMSRPHFAIDSDGHGRVVVNSARVRFVSILQARTPEESAAQTQAAAIAQALERLPPAPRTMSTEMRAGSESQGQGGCGTGDPSGGRERCGFPFWARESE